MLTVSYFTSTVLIFEEANLGPSYWELFLKEGGYFDGKEWD
jgi:hypothetical protein